MSCSDVWEAPHALWHGLPRACLYLPDAAPV